MCTVTFVPGKESFFITSNRDEKLQRATAIEPRIYRLKTGRVIFPKDAHAGGTWIAIHEFGHVIVLLNGAGQPHIKKDRYASSRGLVLLDIIDHAEPVKAFEDSQLRLIEPFTVLIWHKNNLYACRWDGRKKSLDALDGKFPGIWSSVTLYSPEIIAKRAGWFEEWLHVHPSPTQTEILDFHRFTGEGDAHNDLLMNRDGLISTVSITSIKISSSLASMVYQDLKQNKTFEKELFFSNAIPQPS